MLSDSKLSQKADNKLNILPQKNESHKARHCNLWLCCRLGCVCVHVRAWLHHIETKYAHVPLELSW